MYILLTALQRWW